MIRNPLAPYPPAVLALTFALIALAVHAFLEACTKEVAGWGGTHDGK